MQAMLGGTPAGLTAAAAALVSSTTSDPAALRKAIEALEGAFDPHKDGTILKGIREAVQACRESAPAKIERLKQHISVRTPLPAVSTQTINPPIAAPSRH